MKLLPELLQFINERHADEDLRARLSALDTASQHLVARLIFQLSPSANSLRILLQLVAEVSQAQGLSLGDLLSRKEIIEALDAENIPRKEKQKIVRAVLDRLRFPVRTRLEAEIRSCLKDIREELGIAIQTPENLEGDNVEISFSVKSLHDTKGYAEKVAKLASHPSTKRIFDILAGRI